MLIICAGLAMQIAPITLAANATYGPVAPRESLFRIALQHNYPDTTVTQMMIAIFEANPAAFSRDNINYLRVGSTLTIPGPEAVRTIEFREAYNRATAQIAAYQRQLREARGELDEAAPPAAAPREPVLLPAPAQPEITLAKDRPEEVDEQARQAAPIELPEPRVKPQRAPRERRAPLFRYSYDVAVVDDDNVRLAQSEDDIREDVILSATLKATAGRSLDSFSILNYGGSFTYNKFDSFGTLDHYEFEINTRYRFALRSGFTAPIYSLRARLGGMEFDSEMRDSTVLTLAAEMNKWLTTTLNSTIGVGIKSRDSVSEVYDLDEARLFANLDINFTDTDLVYTTLAYIQGDTASSATPSLGIINASDAIEPDDAFGGIDANQFAYRIDSETLVLTLGYNRILNRDLSLDFSARFVDSESRVDEEIYYERTILRASLLGRF